MAIVTTDNQHYTDIAAKIREKTGEETTYKPEEMPDGVEAVYEAGVETGHADNLDTSDATAEAADILAGETAYVNGEKVTGTMPNNSATTRYLTPSVASYTIPEGYHSGAGKVTVGSTTKTVTPTKGTQTVSDTNSFYSKVTVNPIPDAYQNVQTVTATAAGVLTGTRFVASDGTVVSGTMLNNGSVNKILDTLNKQYTIPEGYHSGSGMVYIKNEMKTVTPTKEAQYVTPASGFVLSKVTVDPIPDEYQDVTEVDATAEDVRSGKKIVTADGTVVEGTLVEKADPVMQSKTVTPGAEEQTVTPDSGYDGLSDVTVEGDANLVPENIVSGKSIFGIEGTAEIGGESGEEDIPDDGKTRIFIYLGEERKSPILACCPNGTVTVDWGDGTDPVTLTGTSVSTLKYTDPHEYAELGDYVITLTVDGSIAFRSAKLLCASSTTSNIDYTYLASIKKIVAGDGVQTIGSYAFCYCYALSSVAIPNGTGSIGASAFRYCFALSCVKVPSDVKTINTLAFSDCYGVRYYDFSDHTIVPTLVHTNAFTLIADDCEIRVPAALYDAWIADTNWSTYADYVVAV